MDVFERAATWMTHDPDLAARQFMALINADLPDYSLGGRAPTEPELRKAATDAVKTFIRAYPPKAPATATVV